ncbi:MAG: transposase, partial [Thermoguttaceae bacterium]|nr:transposase [Thermoguttaceae bacterium]
MNRGVLRSKIFSTEQDYDAFVSILSEMQLRIPIRILAWCLMPNHWHLVLWPKTEKEISEYLRLVTGTHVQRWHANHETR